MCRLAFRYTEWDYSSETSFEHSNEGKVKFETGSTANWQPWAASAQIRSALRLLRNLRLWVYSQLPGDGLVLQMEMISFQWEDCGIRNYRTGLLTHTVSNEKIVIGEKKKNIKHHCRPPSQIKTKHQEAVGRLPFICPLCYKVNQLLMTMWLVRLLYRGRQGQITADKPFPAKKHYKQSKNSSASMIQASE